MKDLINKINALQDFINKDAASIVGVEGEAHFKQSFQDEAFSDKSEKDMPWQEVQRRKATTKKGNLRSKKVMGRASANRPILTGESGDLGNSISHKTFGRKTQFTSDKIYAEIHNKGGKTGKNHKATMPKRQFAGSSQILNKKIERKLTKHFKRIMK